MNIAVIGLGSNIDPEKNIEQAFIALQRRFSLIDVSQFLQTKPIGYADQDDFFNGSVLIETDQTQVRLKAALKHIEKNLGRKRSAIKYGPRTIDLDIVIFNGKIIDPDFYDRSFIKNAALELIPELEY